MNSSNRYGGVAKDPIWPMPREFGGRRSSFFAATFFLFAAALGSPAHAQTVAATVTAVSYTHLVSIAAGQMVVDTGPYRLIRHPSYTGALVAFLGLGILFNDWVSLGILMVPIIIAFLRRISIEEAALKEGLGEADVYKRQSFWIAHLPIST